MGLPVRSGVGQPESGLTRIMEVAAAVRVGSAILERLSDFNRDLNQLRPSTR